MLSFWKLFCCSVVDLLPWVQDPTDSQIQGNAVNLIKLFERLYKTLPQFSLLVSSQEFVEALVATLFPPVTHQVITGHMCVYGDMCMYVHWYAHPLYMYIWTHVHVWTDHMYMCMHGQCTHMYMYRHMHKYGHMPYTYMSMYRQCAYNRHVHTCTCICRVSVCIWMWANLSGRG